MHFRISLKYYQFYFLNAKLFTSSQLLVNRRPAVSHEHKFCGGRVAPQPWNPHTISDSKKQISIFYFRRNCRNLYPIFQT